MGQVLVDSKLLLEAMGKGGAHYLGEHCTTVRWMYEEME